MAAPEKIHRARKVPAAAPAMQVRRSSIYSRQESLLMHTESPPQPLFRSVVPVAAFLAHRPFCRAFSGFCMAGKAAKTSRIQVDDLSPDDPFAATRGVVALVSSGCTVHAVGCPLLQGALLTKFSEYHFCLRCVSCMPTPQELVFVNAVDTAPLIHAEPTCLFVGNAGGAAALVCSHCFGRMPPEVAAKFASLQTSRPAAAGCRGSEDDGQRPDSPAPAGHQAAASSSASLQ